MLHTNKARSFVRVFLLAIPIATSCSSSDFIGSKKASSDNSEKKDSISSSENSESSRNSENPDSTVITVENGGTIFSHPKNSTCVDSSLLGSFSFNGISALGKDANQKWEDIKLPLIRQKVQLDSLISWIAKDEDTTVSIFRRNKNSDGTYGEVVQIYSTRVGNKQIRAFSKIDEAAGFSAVFSNRRLNNCYVAGVVVEAIQ